MIVFDPAKDAANIAKHGVSLILAEKMEIKGVVEDDRKDYGEERYLAFGMIDKKFYCFVFTERGGDIRAISLRPAHTKEYRRYVPED